MAASLVRPQRRSALRGCATHQPRREKAKKLTDLTATLRRQHEAGRTVTANIVKLCDGSDAKQLAQLLRVFNRMYRPHAAREDTVLFPVFHDLVGEKAYRELGDQFEDQEKKQLGNEGFEGAVAQVASSSRRASRSSSSPTRWRTRHEWTFAMLLSYAMLALLGAGQLSLDARLRGRA